MRFRRDTQSLMKTAASAARRLVHALGCALLLLGPSALRAQLLQSWQFNDPAGTALPALANAVAGGAAFSPALDGFAADGAGGLAITYNNAVSGRSFADIPDVSTGVLQLDVNVAGWDFTGADALVDTFTPLLEVGLSSVSAGNNATIRTAHIYLEVDAAAYAVNPAYGVLVAGVAGNTGGDGASAAASTDPAEDHLFGFVRTTPITFRLRVDFDTLSYTVSTSDTDHAVLATGAIASGKGANFVSLRGLDDFTIGGSGGRFTIDSITLTYTPPPLTPKTWRDLYFPAPADPAAAGDTADPDGDGIVNLLEYATGTVPTTIDPAPTTVGRDLAGHLTLGFTSIADPNLTYEVFASGDLSAWTRISSATGAGLGAGPQVVADTQPANATARRFLRLAVGPTPATAP